MSAFGIKMEATINGLIDSIKNIRKQVNFLIPKDSDHIF